MKNFYENLLTTSPCVCYNHNAVIESVPQALFQRT